MQLGNAGKTFAVRLRVLDSAYYSNFGGNEWWVGQPVKVPGYSIWRARLQCSPVSLSDWSTYGNGTIYVYGEVITPSVAVNETSTYELEVVATACGTSGYEGTSSVSLPYQTAQYGDLNHCVGSDCTKAPDYTVDYDDITAVVDTFRGHGLDDEDEIIEGGLLYVRGDLDPAVPDGRVDFHDIPSVVDAFRGLGYFYTTAPSVCNE